MKLLKSKKGKIIIGIIALLVVIGIATKGNKGEAASNSFSLEQFEQVKTGMSYEKCVSILDQLLAR